MKKSTTKATLLASTIAGMMALSTSALAVPDAPTEWEKCAGVSKQGKNDCGAKDGSHECAGQAKMDNMDSEWVYLPKGTCEKITGGVVVGSKPAK